MKWWSRVDDSDWGILCSRCARPNRHTSRRAASSRSAHHRTSLAQLFEWLWILSLSLSRQLAGSLLFSDPPYEPYLRCSRKNEKEISCGKKLINRVLLCSPCSEFGVAVEPLALSITIKSFCLLFCLFSVLLMWDFYWWLELKSGVIFQWQAFCCSCSRQGGNQEEKPNLENKWGR